MRPRKKSFNAKNLDQRRHLTLKPENVNFGGGDDDDDGGDDDDDDDKHDSSDVLFSASVFRLAGRPPPKTHVSTARIHKRDAGAQTGTIFRKQVVNSGSEVSHERFQSHNGLSTPQIDEKYAVEPLGFIILFGGEI